MLLDKNFNLLVFNTLGIILPITSPIPVYKLCLTKLVPKLTACGPLKS